MEAAGDKAQRQIWSATDVKKLNCAAVERAQGTTAGVNWDSVSMELGRCVAHVKQKWRRIKLASGKASGGYHQAHFSQLHHCRQNKCPELTTNRQPPTQTTGFLHNSSAVGLFF
jgi:hypothetical protein